MRMNIPFNELRPQVRAIEPEVEAAIRRVLERGWFILGQEGSDFEAEFSAYLADAGDGPLYTAGVASGTDALELALRALEIGPGDEVITVPHTATFTALGLSAAGVTLRFVDIDPETYLLDPRQLETAITPRTRAIVPVHLYGQAADMATINAIAHQHGIDVIEDAAQAHGARYRGAQVGTLGRLAAFSFYPTKNLGAYGDGGAVTTRDPQLAARLKKLRNGGMGAQRYHHDLPGVNSRLDEMQAAILRVKLPHLDAWNTRRRELAHRYTDQLRDLRANGLQVPVERAWGEYIYHLYVVRVGENRRDALADYLKEHGVGTNIHYPVPVHRQAAYASLNLPEGSFPESERAAREVLSLPMYPELTNEQIDYVCEMIRAFYAGRP